MTTQTEMKWDLRNVYEFLETNANSRGLISIAQEQLAGQLGMGVSKFHRLVHKLADGGLLRIAGGGRQPKTIWVIPKDKIHKNDEPVEMPPDERMAVALRLFDAVCEAVATTKT